MKKIHPVVRILGTILLIWVGAFCLLHLGLFLWSQKPFEDSCYVTEDPAEYRDFALTRCYNRAMLFTSTFLPEEIPGDAANVVYSYRAEDLDAYGYEVYLEFTLEDPVEFEAHMTAAAPEGAWHTFSQDSRFLEYSIAQELSLRTLDTREGKSYAHPYIESASIGKVLCNPEDQCFIYVALEVFDGGGVNTEFLCRYFERFDIDPVNIATHLD